MVSSPAVQDLQASPQLKLLPDKGRKPIYTSIRRNIYLFKQPRRSKGDDGGVGCSCKGSKGCLSDCICRMLYTSCCADCGCGDGCLNLPFEKRPVRKLELVKTKHCGWGVISAENIKAGDFLIEYVGEVIDDKTCERRLWALKARGECNFYLCEVGLNMVIDATFKGNLSRFINHSCQPNARMRKWQCDGKLRVGIFATRSILPGDEITSDYKYTQFGTEQECHCGAASCKGLLGSKPTAQPKKKDTETSLDGVIPELVSVCTSHFGSKPTAQPKKDAETLRVPVVNCFRRRKRTAPEPAAERCVRWRPGAS